MAPGFLRRLITNGDGGDKGRGSKSDRRAKNQSVGGESITIGSQKDHEGAIKREGEEEKFASGMPEYHPGLSDKIDSHRGGQLFKYAVITNKPSDERSEFFSKLRVFKPKVKERQVTLSDIPPIRLIGDSIEFDLTMALSKQDLAAMGEYILIDCVLIHYIPLDSFANDKSVVTIQMNDFRKIGSPAVRRCKVDSTMGYNILFTLDYCVEKVDIDKMTVSFANHSKDFQEGIAWGAVKVVAQVMGLSFPKRVPLVDTLGVMIFADTDLQAYECDPRELDLVITPESLKRMREMHERGEIENKTMPASDRKELSTARTVMDTGGEFEPIDDKISKLREEGLKASREGQTVREVLKPKKSSLKKITREVAKQDEDKSSTSESDTGVLNDLSEVEVGDSTSQVGTDEEEMALEVKRSVGFKNLKSVG